MNVCCLPNANLAFINASLILCTSRVSFRIRFVKLSSDVIFGKTKVKINFNLNCAFNNNSISLMFVV